MKFDDIQLRFIYNPNNFEDIDFFEWHKNWAALKSKLIGLEVERSLNCLDKMLRKNAKNSSFVL